MGTEPRDNKLIVQTQLFFMFQESVTCQSGKRPVKERKGGACGVGAPGVERRERREVEAEKSGCGIRHCWKTPEFA